MDVNDGRRMKFVTTFHTSCSAVVGSRMFNNWITLTSFVFCLHRPPPQPPQASTPYSLESESLGMECMISGSASPTLAINTVTNKVLQPAIQPPAPTHTWLHGCTLTPPTSPTTYSTIPHRERSTFVKGRCRRAHTHTLAHKHMLMCLKLLFIATHTKIHNCVPCCTFFLCNNRHRALVIFSAGI